MAGKRDLLLDRIFTVLRMHLTQRYRRASYGLLCLVTAIFCAIALPAAAQWTGERSVTSAQSAPITVNLPSSGQGFDEQARQLYARGAFVRAAIAFERAAATYGVEGRRLPRALALTNLALTQQQIGQWEAANQSVNNALEQLQRLSPDAAQQLALAQAFDIQGSLQLAQGEPQTAITTWRQAAAIYETLKLSDRLAENQFNQIQALQEQGLSLRAIARLIPLSQQLQSAPPSRLQVAVLRSLGDTLRTTGDLALSTEATNLQSLLDSFWAGENPLPGITQLKAVGNLTQAERVLQLCLDMALQLREPDVLAGVYLSLGNLYLAKGVSGPGVEDEGQLTLTKNDQTALSYYEKAGATTLSPQLRLQAQVNRLKLLVARSQPAEVPSLLAQIQPALALLPPDKRAVDMRLNLAQSLLRLRQIAPATSVSQTTIQQILLDAREQVTPLRDPRRESYILGTLAALYEQTGQLTEATRLNNRALALGQSINAGEVTYRWQGQLGRILAKRWRTESQRSPELLESAIAAYEGAIKTIQTLRADLAVLNPDIQFAFRDEIEPIHREFVMLLLESSATNPVALSKARDTIESLQLVELDNFFREACLRATPEQIERVDETAAVIYPILLGQQLSVIVSLPQDSATASIRQANRQAKQNVTPQDSETPRTLELYTQQISDNTFARTIDNLRNNLLSPSQVDTVQQEMQQLYGWILQDAMPKIEQNRSVNTLVFVLDGKLRNIPMTALFDGQKYLIEKYSVAVAPGLQLVASESLSETGLSALVAGLSEAREDFSALPAVKQEVEQLKADLRNSTVLLNERFTRQEFRQSVLRRPFSIVHLASHGKFSSRLEDTFVLAWDGRLNVNELSGLLQTADLTQRGNLELLFLSACSTAEGDDRAALGLAGVAVRSGARSTIASLWQVDDKITAQFISRFYQELKQVGSTKEGVKVTKAEALRQTQLSMLADSDTRLGIPTYWAPFILVGNWM
jgi:CHAT domain-containing protein/tetratricopeptide (TPR) repeat protein